MIGVAREAETDCRSRVRERSRARSLRLGAANFYASARLDLHLIAVASRSRALRDEYSKGGRKIDADSALEAATVRALIINRRKYYVILTSV